MFVAPTSDIDVATFQALFLRQNTIIAGDLNAKNKLWNSSKDNDRGRLVETLIMQHNFVVLNTGHYSHIDLTVVYIIFLLRHLCFKDCYGYRQ